MATTGVLPSYQRFVNGAPLPSVGRRAFRPREKYLIGLVFITFVVVCFGAFFFLPEYKGGFNNVNNVYIKFYEQLQNAPQLLIPPPPHSNDESNVIGVARHGDDEMSDPHRMEDKERLIAKIEEDEMQQKVLERPNLLPMDIQSGGSSSRAVPHGRIEQPVLEKGESRSDIYIVPRNGEDKDPMVTERRNKVKEMMQHAWDSYVRYAWGKNELKPITKRGHSASIFGTGTLGATIVDGLDTLYIMGMDKEYKQGRDWISDHFNISSMSSDLSVFETNIRFIGGFLSCYALTGDPMFRDKALMVAEKLLPAFDSPTGIPYALINVRTGASKNYGWASGGCSILSELGTLHLEFAYLSDVTGNPVFRNKVERIRATLQNLDKPRGLYPNYLNPKTGKWGQYHMSMGALGDSFFEYLLKAWLQSNKEDHEARDMYDEAMSAVMNHMILTSRGGLTYVTDMKFERPENKMDHLACFSGGLFALASTTLQNEVSGRYMDIAAGLTNTCHESYDRSATKLGPESFRFMDGVEAKAIKTSDKYYILRPETIESYLYLWRLTKDPKYREWGWEAVQAIERSCRVSGGYSGIKNVYLNDSQKDDVQQSFFLAETLKYLYLLFSDDSLLPFDQWVFNTEAHPLPIKGVNNLYREKDDLRTKL